MSNLLDNITVVELGTHVAVPLAARMLADWGAKVIKVEGPGGEAWRTVGNAYGLPYKKDNAPIFQVPNANKLSISLNLKTDHGKEVMYKLLGKADIFITNTRMQSLAKMGFDNEALLRKYPQLIFCHFSGYGSKGPQRNSPGFDIASYWAKSGIPLQWTFKESMPPVRPTPGFADATTAPMILSAVLAALHRRDRTGEGDFIETSLLGTALWYDNIGVIMGQEQYGMSFPRSKYEQTAPYNTIFESKDNEFFICAIPNWDRIYNRLLPEFGLEQYLSDDRYTSLEGAKTDIKEVMDTLYNTFKTMNIEDIQRSFQKLDIVFQKIMNPREMTKDEQAWANEFLVNATLENGDKVVLSNNPIKFGKAQPKEFSLAPQLGANTKNIMKGLGYSAENTAEYYSDGSVF